MNKIIISIATVSCFALVATFAHAAERAAEKVNYYKMYDPHGGVQTAPSGVKGVIHREHPIETETEGLPHPHAPIPPVEIMTHPGHSSVDGA